mmetsp:Transcript_13272/g.41054  ORF Transcript_13272/g.41054 Transcript_13272/m.41054 type:complete len:219 (+) Transcript_13272:213-869(+)
MRRLAFRSLRTRPPRSLGAGQSQSRTGFATCGVPCASSSLTPRFAWRQRCPPGCGTPPRSPRRSGPSAPSSRIRSSPWSSTSTCAGPRPGLARRRRRRTTTGAATTPPRPAASERARGACRRSLETPESAQQPCHRWTWTASPPSSSPAPAGRSRSSQAPASPRRAASPTTAAAAVCGARSPRRCSRQRQRSGRASHATQSGLPASSSSRRTPCPCSR